MEVEATLTVAADVGDYLDILADDSDETVGIKEYSVSSYGVDYDIRGYVGRLQSGDIRIPEYQRKYIWDQKRASRFIESLLLDLPVPGIYLYRDLDSEEQLVVDGNQRLQSLRGYYEGRFIGTDKPFRLTGLETRFNGLLYEELDIADRRRLDNSFIRATIIRQDKPDDDATSQYFVFERLNTGGVALASQEIRAAIYGGSLNKLLHELNRIPAWRKLYGKKSDDKRKRDEELILRFLALYFDGDSYRAPMKGFLNKFMKANRNLKVIDKRQIMQRFDDTVEAVLNKLGADAFKVEDQSRSLNAALLDSLMIGISRRLEKGDIVSDISKSYGDLLLNEEYRELISDTTSAPSRVRDRIKIATDAFAAVE